MSRWGGGFGFHLVHVKAMRVAVGSDWMDGQANFLKRIHWQRGNGLKGERGSGRSRWVTNTNKGLAGLVARSDGLRAAR